MLGGLVPNSKTSSPLSEEKNAQAAAKFLSGMANTRRLYMLVLLSEREFTVTDLTEKVGLDQSAVSQHLAKLKALSLVETRPHAQQRFYVCRDKRVALMLEVLREMGLLQSL